MVVKSCLVITGIEIVFIVVCNVVVGVLVVTSVEVRVDILPTSCFKRNILTRVHNYKSMDIGVETTIRIVQSIPW